MLTRIDTWVLMGLLAWLAICWAIDAAERAIRKRKQGRKAR